MTDTESLAADLAATTRCGSMDHVTPRTRPRPTSEPVAVKLPPEVEARVRAGIEASERGDVLELTPQEAEHYYKTGELPERVTRWAASRG